jgi:RecB family endonuclease NucS
MPRRKQTTGQSAGQASGAAQAVQRWIVTLKDPAAMASVLAVAQAEGKVTQRMDEIGVFVIEANREQARRLAKMPGIAAVELDAPVGLEPPDSEIQ